MMSAKTKPNSIAAFKRTIWNYYRAHGRHDLPWRTKITPYRILVSEVMLQQTQVSRVIPKFTEFMKTFPTATSLANATFTEVLRVWQGLGYNRRAKYLQQAAQISKGKFPKTVEELVTLPGIGVNTAGAIIAYAYNLPVVFIETNIRRIFIHEFFKNKKNVADAEIIPLLHACIKGEKNPRAWYWALMDYGAMLGRDTTLKNPNRRSKHYTIQSKFEGSRRQLRGKVLKSLINEKLGKSIEVIAKEIAVNIFDLRPVLQALIAESLLAKNGKKYAIYKG